MGETLRTPHPLQKKKTKQNTLIHEAINALSKYCLDNVKDGVVDSYQRPKESTN